MDEAEARSRFAAARVARLATVTPRSRPRLVPAVFAVDGDVLATAVDRKPKTTRALRRLDDIHANPRVSLLVDHYEDDWDELWWVRADGVAHVVEAGTTGGTAGLALLRAKYERYRTEPPPGPVVLVELDAWRWWSASGS